MMKKTKFANYLKFGIVFIGVSLLLSNCKDDNTFQEELIQTEENYSSFSKRHRFISLNNSPKIKLIVENIKQIKPKNENTLNKDFTFLNDIENLNTEEISEYTNETGYTTYTFKFNNNDTSINFENLYLLETDKGNYIAYILSYEPNESWYYENLNSNGELSFRSGNYQGHLTKYSLEREVIWTTKSINNTQSRGGDFVTVCTYSLPYCDEGNHDYQTGWDGCAYSDGSINENCYSAWASGGFSQDEEENNNNNDDGNSGGYDESSSSENCTNTGTSVVNSQPISGVGDGCTPNNNGGAPPTVSNYTTFWQNLSYSQQNYLTLNPLFKGEIINYLNKNQYAPQAQRLAEDIIDAGINGTLVNAFPFVKYPPNSNYAILYPKLTEYLKNQLPTIKDNSFIVNKIVKYGDLSASEVKSQLEWGKGPVIQVSQLDNACSVCTKETLGLFRGNNPDTLILDIDLVNDLENSTPNSQLANSFSFLVGVTILHEFVHYSEYTDSIWNSPESGELFEVDTYGQTVWRSNALIILKRN